MSKRVVFTGGSGKAGRHAVSYLRYLKPALAAVSSDQRSSLPIRSAWKFPATLSLGITFAIIASGVIWNLV